MGDLIVFGVPAAAIIVALVEFAKKLGLDVKWATSLAVVLGVSLSIVANVGSLPVDAAGWSQIAIVGILVGLSASGLYSGGKALTAK